MKRGFRRFLVTVSIPLSLSVASSVHADSRYFEELAGKHVSDALDGLAERGYQKIGTEQEEGSTQHYLWNGRTGDCEVLSSRDGRVRNVSAVSPSICKGMDRGGQHGGSHSGDRYAQDSGPLPREITGLVGNKRDDAESKLAGQGYQKLEGDRAHGSTSGLWWNRSRGECLSVESKDGRVRSIQREPHSSCN